MPPRKAKVGMLERNVGKLGFSRPLKEHTLRDHLGVPDQYGLDLRIA